MSKSIYEEAIKVVKYLQEQDFHLKDITGTIYISTENITALENLLIHSHKQEKLLKLYQELDKINGWLLLCFTIGGEEIEKEYSQLGGGNRRQELIKQIKELENEN